MDDRPVDPSDERLARAVKDAMWRSEPIRATDLGRLQVEAHAGVVKLRGLVASEAHRIEAAQLARRVPGVKDVVNELVTDEGLKARVAVALASDETTRSHRIAVNVLRGVAGIYGAVPDEATAEAAREVALRVPGVAAVENRLKVVPAGSRVILAWQESVEGRPQPEPATEQTESTTGTEEEAGESGAPQPSATPAPGGAG